MHQTTNPTPPRWGRGPASEGRRAALRSFYADQMTMEGDIIADLDKVNNGTAPVEFKEAFTETINALCNLFDNDCAPPN